MTRSNPSMRPRWYRGQREAYRGPVTEGPDPDPTWGPYPGDVHAPGPTPQAPEIPMSETWPWVAGALAALAHLVPICIGLVVIVGLLGLIVHWW